MTTPIKKLLAEQIKKLPPPVKEMVIGGEFEKKFQEMYPGWGIHADVADQIENETTLVLVGLEHPQDFADNLVENTQLEPEKAGDIAVEINEVIFKPIQKTLLKLYNDVGEENESSYKQAEEQPGSIDDKKTSGINLQTSSDLPLDQKEDVSNSTPKASPAPISRMEEPSHSTKESISEEGGAEEDKDQKNDETYGSFDPYREKLDEE